MITLDRLHNWELVQGHIGIRAISDDDKKFQFVMTPRFAAALTLAIQAASKDLPEYQGPAIVPSGIQPAIGPDVEPALLLNLGGNLTMAISLPPQKLAELKDAIAKIEVHSRPAGGPH